MALFFRIAIEAIALFSAIGIAVAINKAEGGSTALLAWFFVFIFVCWRLRAAKLRHDAWRQLTLNEYFSKRNTNRPLRTTRPGFFSYWFAMLCFFVALIISISIFSNVHFILHLLAVLVLSIVGNLAYLYVKNRNT